MTTLDELRARLRENPEYLAAEKELKPYLDLADNLLNLRLAAGLTQGKLAKLASVSPCYVRRIEAGTHDVSSLRQLQRIADALGAELVIELRRAGPHNCLSDILQQIQAAFNEYFGIELKVLVVPLLQTIEELLDQSGADDAAQKGSR